MRQQLANCDRRVRCSKLRQEPCNRIVEPNLALLDKHHQGRRRRQNLRERCAIEDRIDGHRFAPGDQAAEPVGFAMDNLPLMSDQQDSPGCRAVPDSVIDQGVKVRRPLPPVLGGADTAGQNRK